MKVSDVTGRPLWPVAALTVLLMSACTSSTGSGPNAADAPPRGSSAPGGGGGSPDAPEPSGSTLTSDSQFDREPCAAASVSEMRDALSEPFNVIAGDVLVPEGPPAAINRGDVGPGGAAGCEYRLIAEGTDSAEAYHLITVRVVRLASGGPELMRACQDAAAASPLTYRVLDLADGSCVGPGAVLSLLVGSNHYAVTAAAAPGRADQTDEDVRLGTLSAAAGTVVAQRLPGN